MRDHDLAQMNEFFKTYYAYLDTLQITQEPPMFRHPNIQFYPAEDKLWLVRINHLQANLTLYTPAHFYNILESCGMFYSTKILNFAFKECHLVQFQRVCMLHGIMAVQILGFERTETNSCTGNNIHLEYSLQDRAYRTISTDFAYVISNESLHSCQTNRYIHKKGLHGIVYPEDLGKFIFLAKHNDNRQVIIVKTIKQTVEKHPHNVDPIFSGFKAKVTTHSEPNCFKYWCIPHMHTNLEADKERSKGFARFTSNLKANLISEAKLKDLDESIKSPFAAAIKRPLVEFDQVHEKKMRIDIAKGLKEIRDIGLINQASEEMPSSSTSIKIEPEEVNEEVQHIFQYNSAWGRFCLPSTSRTDTFLPIQNATPCNSPQSENLSQNNEIHLN